MLSLHWSLKGTVGKAVSALAQIKAVAYQGTGMLSLNCSVMLFVTPK